MRKLFIYCILCTILTSCNNSQLKKDLVNLKSMPINYNISTKIYLNNNDTINDEYFNCKYKLIVYHNNVGCTSCSIGKLHQWNDIIKYSKTFNGKFKLYLIFYPPKNMDEDFYFSLKNNPIDYPVLIDENGEFEKLNSHLPKNKAMHTFLLDEDNKVILVGNPLHNKEIEKLFYKMTQEKLSK